MARNAPTKTLVEALALAAAAYRINNNYYVSGRNWYNGMKHQGQDVKINSIIMHDKLTVITEEDQSMAQLMFAHFEGLVFKQLTRKLSDFENNIALLVTANRAQYQDMGLVGYLPALYTKEVKQEKVEEELNTVSSLPYGQVGSKVQLNVKVIDVKQFALYNNYLYTCTSDDKFIFSFFHKELIEETQLAIRGKVRSHSKDKYGNHVTNLNYVKQI